MIDRLMDVVTSLVLVMQEETDRLRQYQSGQDLADLAAAKVRLVGMLERISAHIDRERLDWNEALNPEGHAQLRELLLTLNEVSATNAAVLERQIDLSVEMIGAIAAEAKRLAGRATATYGAEGSLSRFDPTMPIAINSHY